MGDTSKEGAQVNVFVCISCCLLSFVPLVETLNNPI